MRPDVWKGRTKGPTTSCLTFRVFLLPFLSLYVSWKILYLGVNSLASLSCRYYFKKASDEFECGAVFEEVSDDGSLLPTYEGKILGKVERMDWGPACVVDYSPTDASRLHGCTFKLRLKDWRCCWRNVDKMEKRKEDKLSLLQDYHVNSPPWSEENKRLCVAGLKTSFQKRKL